MALQVNLWTVLVQKSSKTNSKNIKQTLTKITTKMKTFLAKLDDLTIAENVWICSSTVIAVVCLGGLTMAYGGLDFLPRTIITMSTAMTTLVCLLTYRPPSLIIKISIISIISYIILLLV